MSYSDKATAGMSDKMDPNYLVDQPNRVAEIYRNYRPIMMPLEVEKQLDFIDISEDGHTIVGSSNLSGRYWKGSVWYFSDPGSAPNKEDCDTGIECDSSVCDGKFLDSSKTIVVGDDSGAVTVYQLEEQEDGSSSFTPKSTRYEHDSCVLSISVSSDRNGIVTAGMDMCIKVWEGAELSPAHTYRSAHSHHVTGVAHPPDASAGTHVFASCGLDGAALVWDTRQPQPASVVINNPSEGLTALSWLTSDANTLALGSSFGAVSLVDLRSFTTLQQSSPYKRAVYKLLSIKPSYLAACADSHEVKVINSSAEDLTVSYVDERHTDFIRGLSYDSKAGVLYSCGWDKQVLSHVLP